MEALQVAESTGVVMVEAIWLPSIIRPPDICVEPILRLATPSTFTLSMGDAMVLTSGKGIALYSNAHKIIPP